MKRSTIVIILVIVMLAIFILIKFFSNSTYRDNIIYKKGSEHHFQVYHISTTSDTAVYHLTLAVPENRTQFVLGTRKARIPAIWKISNQLGDVSSAEAEVLDDQKMATLTSPAPGALKLLSGAAPLLYKEGMVKAETITSSSKSFKNGSWESSTIQYKYSGEGKFNTLSQQGMAHKIEAIVESNGNVILQKYYFKEDSGFVFMQYQTANGDQVLIEKL